MAIAELQGVRKYYQGLERPALDGIDLKIESGQIVVIVGSNGSGKTTAMEILSGLRIADSGNASINGRRVVPGGLHRYDIGVQLQEAGLPQRLRVHEAVRAVSSLYRDPGDVQGIIDALGLADRRRQMVDQLSGGWQRRLDIALACIGRPKLLILDEPTSGLDPSARAELWEFLKRLRAQGVAVLASTHDLSEAESFADRLLVLDRGRILLDGPVEQVLASAGGEWRLKVTDPDSGVDELLEAQGAVPVRGQQHVTVIGDHETILSYRQCLENARTATRIEFQESTVGRVRLEDVFAYAATLHTDEQASGRRSREGTGESQ